MKTARLMVRATAEQYSLFKQAAEAEGMTLSAWIIHVALREARKVLRREK